MNEPDTTKPIIFYFDPISPFGYLGSVQIERFAKAHNRQVEWRPILIGVTIVKVMGLRPLPETPLKGDYLRRDIVRLSEYFDIPYQHHGLKGISSVNALRAFVFLNEEDHRVAKLFAQRIFDRLWVRHLNISNVDDVLEEAGAIGVDTTTLQAAISSEPVKTLLKQKIDDAIAAGVFGAPFFVVDGEPIWGVDRMWMIEQWITHHSWSGRA